MASASSKIHRARILAAFSLLPLACFTSPFGRGAASMVEATGTGGPGATEPSGASSSSGSSFCGDGVIDAGEACDDGNGDDADDCTNACSAAVCGDGVKAEHEACDGVIETALCDADCTEAVCGDKTINAHAGEACDDGENEGGDACSASCALTEIVDIAVGADHTCVVFGTGVVRCWGQNEYGALCQGDTRDLGKDPGQLPVADINTGGRVIHASSGGAHTCTVDDNGFVRCWGYGGDGQLGNGGFSNNLGDAPGEVPPTAIDVGGNVAQVAAGGKHTCVLMTGSGRVRCWGAGEHGQLGYESAESMNAPLKVLGVYQDVEGAVNSVQLALGSLHTCALLGDGDVRCWGDNRHGQLGLGHKDSIGDDEDELPQPVISLGGAVAQIAAGGFHNCALMRDDRSVRCWGYDEFGQLGDGNSGALADVGDDADEVPVAVGLGGPVKQVVAGYAHTCALLEAGAVKCWGSATDGVLGYGDGELEAVFPPADLVLGGEVSLLGSSAGTDPDANPDIYMGGGGRSTCALLKDMSLRCWGYNNLGQLGHGHRFPVGDNETPDYRGPIGEEGQPNHAGPVPF